MEPNASARLPREAKAAIIPCKGLIDQSLLYPIKRCTETALHSGANYLISMRSALTAGWPMPPIPLRST